MNDSIVSSQVFLSMLGSLLIQWAKNNKAPVLAWINHCTPNVTRAASAALAALIAAGFTASYDSHGGTLIVNGLTLQGVLLFLWLACRSFLTQHFTYKLIQTAAAAKILQRAATRIETEKTSAL